MYLCACILRFLRHWSLANFLFYFSLSLFFFAQSMAHRFVEAWSGYVFANYKFSDNLTNRSEKSTPLHGTLINTGGLVLASGFRTYPTRLSCVLCGASAAGTFCKTFAHFDATNGYAR